MSGLPAAPDGRRAHAATTAVHAAVTRLLIRFG
jgi:hypothetical protein